jgi:hypothetical protein
MNRDPKATIIVCNPKRAFRCAVCLAPVMRNEMHAHTADAWKNADDAILANDDLGPEAEA